MVLYSFLTSFETYIGVMFLFSPQSTRPHNVERPEEETEEIYIQINNKNKKFGGQRLLKKAFVFHKAAGRCIHRWLALNGTPLILDVIIIASFAQSDCQAIMRDVWADVTLAFSSEKIILRLSDSYVIRMKSGIVWKEFRVGVHPRSVQIYAPTTNHFHCILQRHHH